MDDKIYLEYIEEYTRHTVNPAIKRYIRYKEKDLGRTCRKIWVFTNTKNETYMYANFCKNYNRLIITIAYYQDPFGPFIPMEIGR